MTFSEEYGRLRGLRSAAREGRSEVPEDVVHCIWYDRLFAENDLRTHDGRPIRILSPGWWNRSEGPDFRGAQLEIAGRLRTGDVEVHLYHGAWRQHSHHLDERYDDVILEVVLESEPPKTKPVTSAGKTIPCLLLSNYMERDVRELADQLQAVEDDRDTTVKPGYCATLTDKHGPQHTQRLVMLAGEWRSLAKARRFRERMERAGSDQALYEALLEACGFKTFKHHFLALARQFPYDRARQLALRDPLLLETALLQLAGLLPSELPNGTTGVPHFARLRALHRDELSGLKSLPLTWKRTGVRPNNYPERRLVGAALLVARTAPEGLADTLERIWAEDRKPVERRRAFEALFPKGMGFWATHCSWTGKRLDKPVALLGPGRVRSIIGNVFIPAGLAWARRQKDRLLEERVVGFFGALPKEPGNRVLTSMAGRLFGEAKPPRMNFHTQQGLLQIYHDWCEPNPSCRNCPVIQYLDSGYPASQPGG